MFAIPDIYYLLRYSHQIYNFFCFVNADERRQKDFNYRIPYSVVNLPLVRTMIDCLYNISAILTSPGPRAYQFRESGLRQMLRAVDADEQRYGGNPAWDNWIRRYREFIDRDMKGTGITKADVESAKLWPTLGKYLKARKKTPLTAHQEFLKKLTLGFWQEYSGISHATFQGLVPIASFLAPKDLPHERRPLMEESMKRIVALHLSRVAGILLCTSTEIQAYFRFDRDQNARIDQRLHKTWNALTALPEIKELYDGRYSKLMRDKNINP